MEKKCGWIEKATFLDPDYGSDVTEGVREVLKSEHSDNIIGGHCNGELLKVEVSYVTRRGNLKQPVKYLLLQECPRDDKKLRAKVTQIIDAAYTIKNVYNPYRAVKDVSVGHIERYADVRM